MSADVYIREEIKKMWQMFIIGEYKKIVIFIFQLLYWLNNVQNESENRGTEEGNTAAPYILITVAKQETLFLRFLFKGLQCLSQKPRGSCLQQTYFIV